MLLTFVSVAVAVVLLVVMLALFEVGRRFALARRTRDPEGAGKGAGAVEAAIFGLLGLLFAFTFSGAGSRFEERRHQVTEEANLIGTAYLRIDLLPSDVQAPMRDLFRRYTEVRANVYRDGTDLAQTKARMDKTAELQNEIWAASVAACRRPDAPPSAMMLVVTALNPMIDITTTRARARHNHPPSVIYALLGGVSLISAFMIGNATGESKTPNRLYPVIFAATIALTFYVIIDLEFPRAGLIRIDTADDVLFELRQTMK